jgi:hypothetical protein
MNIDRLASKKAGNTRIEKVTHVKGYKSATIHYKVIHRGEWIPKVYVGVHKEIKNIHTEHELLKYLIIKGELK